MGDSIGMPMTWMRAVCVLIGAFAWPSLAWSQAALDVRVLDAEGNPIAAQVRLTNPGQGITLEKPTDAQGRARFGALPAASGWIVSASNDNAQTQSAPFNLRSDFTRGLTLVLGPSAVDTSDVETIDVRARPAITALNTTNAEVSATLTADEIARIPVEARSLERLLFRLPGVTQSTGFFGEAPSVAINGANALYTNYMIDGLDNNENFLGGQKFALPIGAVQDVTVLVSSYSVEFGRTANGVINVTTPSGDNDLGGEVVFVTRPGGFLTETAEGTLTSLFGAPVSDSFERYQGAFSLKGPIKTDKTFFFFNVEYIRDETDNLLSVPEIGTAATLPGTNEQLLLTGRIDHIFNERWRAALRINHGQIELERQGGGLDGGTTFPSAGSVQDRVSTNIALSVNYSGTDFDYTGAFLHSRFDWDFGQPINGPGPQVTLFEGGDLTRPVATIGHPGFIFDNTERTYQTKHMATWTRGKHRFKAGLDIVVAEFDLFGGGNVNGNFQVSLSADELSALASAGTNLTVADLPSDAQVLSAVFESQPNAFGRTQQVYSVFAEDRVQVRDDLSLTFGLRWDYDTLTGIAGNGDFDNISPRIGFNYS
ncbi:MAG: TonB-dependent receptor, partial [Pseudomonadota bacterium]